MYHSILAEIKRLEDRLRAFKGGISWEKYNECKTNNRTALECSDLLKESCLQSRYRVSKIIRMSMDIISLILDSIDTIKVIFLVRDPRAIMMSRLEIDYMCPSIDGCVPALCRKMTTDSKLSVQLEDKYPDRFKTIKYEDIASDPVFHASQMYKFINFAYTQADMDKIYHMTHSTGADDDEMFSTSRQNSTETAWQWKKQINATVIQLMDKYCSGVYNIFGYPQSKELQLQM